MLGIHPIDWKLIFIYIYIPRLFVIFLLSAKNHQIWQKKFFFLFIHIAAVESQDCEKTNISGNTQYLERLVQGCAQKGKVSNSQIVREGHVKATLMTRKAAPKRHSKKDWSGLQDLFE